MLLFSNGATLDTYTLLDRFLVRDPFVILADVVQQFLSGFLNLGNSLLVTVLYAICTPSLK